MAPKHPYIHEAEKAVFLDALDHGENTVHAAKRAKINIKTARCIKERADAITHSCIENTLPLPSLHDRCAIAPKSGRRKVLLELNI